MIEFAIRQLAILQPKQCGDLPGIGKLRGAGKRPRRRRQLAVLRIFTGIFWLTHGVPKLLNPKFFGSDGMLAGMLHEATANSSGPYNSFLTHVVLPNANLFSHLVAWGETLVGVSLLLGLFSRVGGFFGVFLPLSLMSDPLDYSEDG